MSEAVLYCGIEAFAASSSKTEALIYIRKEWATSASRDSGEKMVGRSASSGASRRMSPTHVSGSPDLHIG